ncbi:MAG: aspartate kinase, partial [Salibacteraceae bacterium]
MKVLKFGGTSVGSPERMRGLAELVRNEGNQIVVLSAVSGTTNSLVEICDSLYKKDKEEALTVLGNLKKDYSSFVNELINEEPFREETLELVAAVLNGINSYIQKEINHFVERAILAQGEILSTNIFYQYSKSQGLKPVLVSALDFMRTDDKGEPDQKFIEENLSFELSKYPNKSLFITQGYICRNAFGQIDNLKRGGSDYSASLIGAAINADEIQIWT